MAGASSSFHPSSRFIGDQEVCRLLDHVATEIGEIAAPDALAIGTVVAAVSYGIAVGQLAIGDVLAGSNRVLGPKPAFGPLGPVDRER